MSLPGANPMPILFLLVELARKDQLKTGFEESTLGWREALQLPQTCSVTRQTFMGVTVCQAL